jgi:hypothetical protein
MMRWLFAGLLAAAALSGSAVAQETAGAATANSCIACHGKLDEKKLAEPVPLWHLSVHKPAGIACQDCHGGNPTAMAEEQAHDPNAGYIGTPPPETFHEVCGTCHQLQKDNYLPSPHGIEGSFWPSCVDCHSNHEVKHPVAAEISVPDKCEDCHEQEVLDRFIAVVDRGLAPLAGFRQAADELRPAGVPVDEIIAQARMAEDAFDQQASHTFNLQRIGTTVDSLEGGYDSIQKRVEAARTEVGVRRRFGWMFAVLLVVMAGVIWLYRRALPDE